MTRAFVVAGFAFVVACAHVEPSTPPPVVDDGALALQRCVDDSDACPALAKRLETKLRDHYDTSAAHRLAWQMTAAFGGGDGSIVGSAVARCRAGHAASCRALWWAIDRLYLADDATIARANDCALTGAVASAFAAGARPLAPASAE